MPLLYSVAARGSTVLAKYASCTGNFEEVTEQILTKIPLHNDKLTYSQGPFLFHYICEDGIIYMCITDDVRTIMIVSMNNYIQVTIKKRTLLIMIFCRTFKDPEHFCS